MRTSARRQEARRVRDLDQRDGTATRGRRSSPIPPERSAWIGWIIFAALMLVLLGIFQLVAGFVAVVDEDYFQQTGAAPLFLARRPADVGGLQLVLGAVAILTGAGLLYGNGRRARGRRRASCWSARSPTCSRSAPIRSGRRS